MWRIQTLADHVKHSCRHFSNFFPEKQFPSRVFLTWSYTCWPPFYFTLFKTSKQQPCRDLPPVAGKWTAGSETSVQFTATSCHMKEWALGSLEARFFYIHITVPNHFTVLDWNTNQAHLSTSFDLIRGTWRHMTYVKLYMLWLRTRIWLDFSQTSMCKWIFFSLLLCVI